MKNLNFSFRCDENPMKMDVVDGNKRHCTKCERNIVDFTKFTPQQITDYIKNNKKPCGFMFPWQEDEINNEIDKSNANSSHLLKFAKIAAVAGTPLLVSPAFAQKNIPAVEYNSTHRSLTNFKTEVQIKDNADLPIDSLTIEIYDGTILLNTLVTDENGKIFIDHSIFPGKSVVTLKNKILGMEYLLALKQESSCVIWKTEFSKKEQQVIEQINKFDFQFVYYDKNNRPIRHTKIDVDLYDSSNVMLETIKIKSNMSGYSAMNTKNIGRTKYISFTLYTRHGRKSAYKNILDIDNKDVNVVRVNRKFRRHTMGVMF